MKKRTHNKISFLTKCNLLIFIFIVNILLVNFHIIANKISTTESSKYGNSFPNSLTINENFRDDEVVVVLKKEYGGLNKEIINEDYETENVIFKEQVGKSTVDYSDKLVIDSIEDLSHIENENVIKNKGEYLQILSIKLQNKSKENVLLLIEELKKLNFVQSAEPNYYYDIEWCTNDTLYDYQWGLNGNNNIGIEDAWSFVSYGNTSPLIKIGIFEESVQMNHSDLRTVSGNFIPSSNSSANHGTHVAGIIGAITNNNSGIAGVSQVEIALLDISTFSSSITWAINNNIRIINASFVFTDPITGAYSSPSNCHIAAINNLNLSDGLLICAAGNDNNNNDNNPPYPASYANQSLYPTICNVISVGAIDKYNYRCDFSNYGTNSVNIYAPGKDIISTYPTSTCFDLDFVFYDGTVLCEMEEKTVHYLQSLLNNEIDWNYIDENFSDFFENASVAPANFKVTKHVSSGYHCADGTSMAAPFITGTASLLLSINQNLTNQQIITAIISGANSISINVGGSNNQNVLKLNVFGAVKYVLQNYSNLSYNLNNTNFSYSDNKEIVSGNSYFNNKNGFYKLNVSFAKYYTINITSNYPFTAKLYDSSFNEITYNSTTILYGTSINNYLSVGTYYLKTYFLSNQSGIINTVITGSHQHSYNYTWQNYMKHNATCACGESHLEMHITNGVPISPGSPYSYCLLCGGLVLVTINSPSNSTNNYLIEKNNYKSAMYFYKLFNNKSVNNLIC